VGDGNDSGLQQIIRLGQSLVALGPQYWLYDRNMSGSRTGQFRFWPDGYQGIAAVHRLVADSGLEPSLLELVRLRASQINGCAYCIDMHSRTRGRQVRRSSGCTP